MEAVGVDFYLEQLQIEKPEWQGTITLYHIVSAKTYQGSVTYYLQTQAEAFERNNRGVFIEVIGMSEEDYKERLEYGRTPDAFSFFAGSVYREQLQFLNQDYGGFVEGLRALEQAVPYLYSGYAACKNEQGADGETLCASEFSAARLGRLGISDAAGFSDNRYQNAVLDLRSVGDCIRAEKVVNLSVEAVDNFTEQVCYLGIAKGTSADKAYWCEQFFLWLLSDKAQQELSSIGAFCAKSGVEQEFSSRLLVELKTAYSTVTTVEPFEYYSNKEALWADAALAAGGDAAAGERFIQRLGVVLL